MRPSRFRHSISLLLIVLFAGTPVFAAPGSTTLEFNFNDHTLRELHNRLGVRAVGVMLSEDRFGNQRSALYLQGHASSFMEIEGGELIKPNKGSLSIWVKMERKVYAGKGYESNPILMQRNSNREDFYDAYSLYYDFHSDRMMIFFTKDSTEQSGVNSIDHFEFNKWVHYVFTYDNTQVSFYMNGVKQGSARKNFESVFLPGGPLCLGHSASTKNDRRTRGSFDDLKIFDRVLTEQEILDLYHAPNPNRLKLALQYIMKWLLLAGAAFLLAFLSLRQRKKALRREQEHLALKARLLGMQIRTLKAQMNPHFIFNSLNSIRELIARAANEKAEEYLEKFSRLLRSLMESNLNESLSIAEETEILEQYLEIEELRFRKAFGYSIETDERIDGRRTCIPHLMVQPFVENAIWYGLLPREGEKRLRIRFDYISKSIVRCIVDDNGVGRQAGQGKPQTFKKTSLGLSLVRQRLELIAKTLNTGGGIEITDKKKANGESDGTCVILLLPVLPAASCSEP
ncbi:MAG: histidine kinase [Chitinophagaceae bacterium]|nr:histidine kinase [Chitinophagaceae bacterium]